MQTTTVILVLIAMAVAAFYFGRGRSVALVGGPQQGIKLHSLPGYYGYYTAMWCLIPALAVLLIWTIIEPKVIIALVVHGLPPEQQNLDPGKLNLLVNNIRNLAVGDAISGTADTMLRQAALDLREYTETGRRLSPGSESSPICGRATGSNTRSGCS